MVTEIQGMILSKMTNAQLYILQNHYVFCVELSVEVGRPLQSSWSIQSRDHSGWIHCEEANSHSGEKCTDLSCILKT